MRSAFVLIALWAAAPALSQAAQPPVLDPVVSKRCAAAPAAFGCANGANLGVMAEQADLVGGRPLSPAQGAQEAAAVGRLLADKVKDLRREGTEGSGGGPQ